MSAQLPIALVCSVELEAEPLRSLLQRRWTLPLGRLRACGGRLGGTEVVLLAAGMGKTNAAHALTLLLERRPARAVVGFGVGGAYPGSGLSVGDIAVATAEIYGDEGVASPEGWLSTEGIGIPLVERAGERLFNELPLEEAVAAAAARALRAAGQRTVEGPFVTVSCCSGTATRGEELAERFSAVCETMEGAAYAHVSALYGLRYVGVRGISNQVEDRDLSRWRLQEAAGAAARAVSVVLERVEL